MMTSKDPTFFPALLSSLQKVQAYGKLYYFLMFFQVKLVFEHFIHHKPFSFFEHSFFFSCSLRD